MGLFKKLFKGAVGTAGKYLMGVADSATGGLASKLTNTVVQGANKHAGVIGKVMGGIGRAVLNDNAREKLSKFADSALKYIPGGAVKTALKKINNAAQGREHKVPGAKGDDENYGFKEKHNKQLNSTEANSHAETQNVTTKPRRFKVQSDN